MANSISLSEGVRNTLTSLQGTSSMIEKTQFKLSTGRKVNSALDDPSSYFAAKGLTNRAADLAARKDGIVQGIKTVEAALNGLERIEDVLKQMKSLAEQAKATSDTTKRASLMTQFNDLKTQLDSIATDSGYQGVNLISDDADNLVVTFNEDSTSVLTVSGLASDATTGLGVADGANWGNADTAVGNTAIEASLTLIKAAIDEVRSNTQTLGTNAALLNIRKEFTDSLVNTLQGGAASLVNADLNEESANMLALQTRQQLGTTALSMAAQAEQAVLRLF